MVRVPFEGSAVGSYLSDYFHLRPNLRYMRDARLP
jgi:hypothetical protein